jgi:hypothetical protein
MPIKIDAPRVVAWKFKSGILARILLGTDTTPMDLGWTATRGRWVSDSDYRKIMAALRAAENGSTNAWRVCDQMLLDCALDALGKKGKK